MISNAVHNSRALLCALITITVLNGCAARPAVETQPPDPCAAGDGAADSAIRFALARDGAVEFVATQLYETLVRVDCTGAIRPALASSWSDSAGIAWRFELKPDIRFSDGRLLDAQSVLRSWTSTNRSIATSFAALSADGTHVVRVMLHEPARIQLFADPELSVTGDTGDPVLSGTTEWRVAYEDPPRLQSAYGRMLSPVVAEDLRATLNDGVHGLVTADPDVIAYARTRSEYELLRLPWTRTYVIATAGSQSEPRLPAEVLATFARDVVSGDVRAAEGPFWWESATCGAPGVRFSNREARDIVHPQGDPVARALAERIAALAWPPASAPAWVRELLPSNYGSAGAPRVRGLEDGALLTAIRARLPLAVVAPLPLMFDRMCMRSAPESAARALLSSGWQLTPALDARALLIHRSGLGGATVDAFGRIRIDPR